MILQNEKQLVKIIKYIPTFFLITISLIILSFLYIENIKSFNKQKEEIHSNYIIKSKALIKERVDNTYNYILSMQQSTEKELKKSLKNEMDRAFAIANSIYEHNKNTKSENEVKKLIMDAIRPITFNNGRGYFFIHDINTYSNAMHPIMPHLEGKNSYNVKDARGAYIIRQMHKALSKKEDTFFEWYWYKPGNKETQYKKIGYIRNFGPYKWFFGTGEYVVDFEKQVQTKVLENIASIKYNNNGYIFAITHEGKILNYFQKEMINKNAFDMPNFKEETKKLIDIAKYHDSSYTTYSHIPNPKHNKPTTKTSYLKNINEWSWVIGTGFYEDDISEIIKNKKQELDENILLHMKNTIIISIILAMILLFLSFYLASMIKKRFKKYKKEIDKHLKDKVKQEKILAQQAKMAAMGEMIGNIAHQWRQPLSSITSNATSMIVQKEINVLDDVSLKKGLEEINKKAQYLSITIDDFRNFFNTNKNKSTFSLNESIKETLSILDSQFKQNDIRIIDNIKKIKLHNYKNEFVQVLINILNNAKDVLSPKHSDKLIFIDALKENDNLIITIKDTGGGVNEEIMDKIFEPYFTTKHQFQGTGIGLYMSTEIITKHMNGLIEVSNEDFLYENKRHKGAMFKITIPLNNKI